MAAMVHSMLTRMTRIGASCSLVLALASVGVFYLPAAAALVIAVVGWRDLPAAPPAADDPWAANQE